MATPAALTTELETSMSATAVAEVVSLIQRLSFARSTAQVMDVIRYGLRRLIKADGITFVLREGEHCFYAEEDAIAPLWKGRRFPMSTCISGWAMLHRETAVIPDIFADPRIPHDAYRPTFVHSLAMAPVRREDPVAAIGAYWAAVRLPEEDEVMLLEMVANAAAVAIANVGLNASLEEALRHEEAQSAELRKVQARLEAASEAKSRFLAALCHDLSQPLQGMRLYQHLLVARFAGQGEERIFDGLETAISAGERLLKATQDLAALDAGLVKAAIERVAVGNLLGAVAEGFAGEVAAKGLSLTTVPSTTVALSDGALLAALLNALVANAIRFTPHGRVLLGARRAGDCVRIVVADTGIGIDADKMDSIFEDLYQIGNQARDGRHGFGLGLGLVRRIAGLLGHGVDVVSRPVRGTMVTVTLPAAGPRTS